MQIACEKLNEAKAKLRKAFSSDQDQEQKSKSSGNDVLSSYTTLLETCLNICAAWRETVSLEQLESGSDQQPDDKDKDKDKKGEKCRRHLQFIRSKSISWIA